MSMKYTPVWIMVASALALSACSDKDDDDDDDDADTDTDTDSDTDSDSDSDSDTDTDSDSDADSDTGIALIYWIGEAQVESGADPRDGTYLGYEAIYSVTYPDGADFCTLSYDVTGVPHEQRCDACEWAFDIAGSDAGATSDGGIGCAAVMGAFGFTDPSEVGVGWQFGYGYSSDYYGYEAMFYYYYGYGWYAPYYAEATYDPGSKMFQYSWYSGGFYFYWDEL